MELHRNSLGEDYIPQPSSSNVIHRAASPMSATTLTQNFGRSSSPVSHDHSVDKGTHKEGLNILNAIMKLYILLDLKNKDTLLSITLHINRQTVNIHLRLVSYLIMLCHPFTAAVFMFCLFLGVFAFSFASM